MRLSFHPVIRPDQISSASQENLSPPLTFLLAPALAWVAVVVQATPVTSGE
jgi:hypothetical protein